MPNKDEQEKSTGTGISGLVQKVSDAVNNFTERLNNGEGDQIWSEVGDTLTSWKEQAQENREARENRTPGTEEQIQSFQDKISDFRQNGYDTLEAARVDNQAVSNLIKEEVANKGTLDSKSNIYEKFRDIAESSGGNSRSENKRQNATFTRENRSWANRDGTTGSKRNETDEKGSYHWKGYTDKNGNFVSGFAEWAEDNQARITAGIDRYNDAVKNNKYLTESEVQVEEQEWANLHYDCGELEEYQQKVVDEFKAKYDQEYQYASDEEKKALDEQLANYEHDLGVFKSWKEKSQEMYNAWVGLNEIYSYHDDDKLLSADTFINDPAYFASPEYGGDTVENLNKKLARLDKAIAIEEGKDKWGTNSTLTTYKDEYERTKKDIELAKEREEDLRKQVEDVNDDILIGRKYIFASPEKLKEEEVRLSNLQNNPSLSDEERAQVDKDLAYVQKHIESNQKQAFKSEWSEKTDEEIKAEIDRLIKGPEAAFSQPTVKPSGRSVEEIQADIDKLEAQFGSLNPLKDVEAWDKIQEQIDVLTAEKASVSPTQMSTTQEEVPEYKRTAEEELKLQALESILEDRALDSVDNQKSELKNVYDQYMEQYGEQGAQVWMEESSAKTREATAAYNAFIEENVTPWKEAEAAYLMGEFYAYPKGGKYDEVCKELKAAGIGENDTSKALDYIRGKMIDLSTNSKEAQEYYKAVVSSETAAQIWDSTLKDRSDYNTKVAEGQKKLDAIGGIEGLRKLYKGGVDKLASGLNISTEDAKALHKMLGTLGVDEGMFTPSTTELDSNNSWKNTLRNFVTSNIAGEDRPDVFSADEYNNFLYLFSDDVVHSAEYALEKNSAKNAAFEARLKEKAMNVTAYDKEKHPGAFAFFAVVDPVATAVMNMTGIVDYVKTGSQIKNLGHEVATGMPSLAEWSSVISEVNSSIIGQGNYGFVKPDVVEFLYNAYSSMIQSRVNAAAVTKMAGGLGLVRNASPVFLGKNAFELASGAFSDVAFFGSASMDTYRELRERGIDPARAWNVGTAAGVFEAAFEHISLDKIIHEKDVFHMKNWWEALGEVIVHNGVEGVEEICTETANKVYERMTLGEDSTFWRNVTALRKEGLTKAEAIKKEYLNEAKEILLAGAAGFVSSMAPASVSTFSAYARSRKEIKGAVKILGSEINKSASNSEGETLAQRFGTFLGNYEFYVAEGVTPNQAQKKEINTLKEIATKAAEGKASDEELAQMIVLANRYDTKLYNDFVMDNLDAFLAISPGSVGKAVINTLSAIYGEEDASNFLNAFYANPNAYVEDEFKQGLRNALGDSEYTPEYAEQVEALIGYIVTGNSTYDEETLRKTIQAIVKDDKTKNYIIQFLGNQIAKYNRGNKRVFEFQKENNPSATSWFAAVTDQSALTGDFEDSLVNVWSGVKEAVGYAAIHKQARESTKETLENFLKSLGAVSKTQMAKYRDDGDFFVAKGPDGKDHIFTREYYIQQHKKGIDPLTGQPSAFKDLVDTDEKLNAEFDGQIRSTLGAGGLADMVRYNLRTGEEKTAEQTQRQKEQIQDIMGAYDVNANILRNEIKEIDRQLQDLYTQAEMAKASNEPLPEQHDAAVKNLEERKAKAEADLKIIQERSKVRSNGRIQTHDSGTSGRNAGTDERRNAGGIPYSGTGSNSGGSGVQADGGRGSESGNSETLREQEVILKDGDDAVATMDNGTVIYDSDDPNANTDKLTSEEKDVLQMAKEAGVDRLIFVDADQLWGDGNRAAGYYVIIGGKKIIIVNSNRGTVNGYHEAMHYCLDSYTKEEKRSILDEFVAGVFKSGDEFASLFNLYNNEIHQKVYEPLYKAFKNGNKAPYYYALYEEMLCDLWHGLNRYHIPNDQFKPLQQRAYAFVVQKQIVEHAADKAKQNKGAEKSEPKKAPETHGGIPRAETPETQEAPKVQETPKAERTVEEQKAEEFFDFLVRQSDDFDLDPFITAASDARLQYISGLEGASDAEKQVIAAVKKEVERRQAEDKRVEEENRPKPLDTSVGEARLAQVRENVHNLSEAELAGMMRQMADIFGKLSKDNPDRIILEPVANILINEYRNRLTESESESSEEEGTVISDNPAGDLPKPEKKTKSTDSTEQPATTEEQPVAEQSQESTGNTLQDELNGILQEIAEYDRLIAENTAERDRMMKEAADKDTKDIIKGQANQLIKILKDQKAELEKRATAIRSQILKENKKNKNANRGSVIEANAAKGSKKTPNPTADTHIDNRSIDSVGKTNINAFQYDNPEIKPFFKRAAEVLMHDLIYLQSTRRNEYGKGTFFEVDTDFLEAVRNNFESINDAVAACEAVIYDKGGENYVGPKRIEIFLDQMLTNGYTPINQDSETIEPSIEYINLKGSLEGGTPFDARQKAIDDLRLAYLEDGLTDEELGRIVDENKARTGYYDPDTRDGLGEAAETTTETAQEETAEVEDTEEALQEAIDKNRDEWISLMATTTNGSRYHQYSDGWYDGYTGEKVDEETVRTFEQRIQELESQYEDLAERMSKIVSFDDSDIIISSDNGQPITRREFVDRAMQGLDPFDGIVPAPAMTREEANEEFNTYIREQYEAEQNGLYSVDDSYTPETPDIYNKFSVESLANGTGVETLYQITGSNKTTTLEDWITANMRENPELTRDSLQNDFSQLVESGAARVIGVARRDPNGNLIKVEIDEITPAAMKNSPLGQMITYAKEFGKISEEEANRQYGFLADLVKLLYSYDDTDFVWRVVGSEMFAAIKNNSDPQYGKTIDFSTICKKTQATVDAISKTMKLLGTGLSKEEIKFVYKMVGEAGESTPCPVCYVFSRWMGLGSVLDNIKRYQDMYGDRNPKGQEEALKLVKEVQDRAMDYIKGRSFGKAVNAAQADILKKLKAAEENFQNYPLAQLGSKDKKINRSLTDENGKAVTQDYWADQISTLAADYDKFDAYKWAIKTRLINAELLVKNAEDIAAKLRKTYKIKGDTVEAVLENALQSPNTTENFTDLVNELSDNVADLKLVEPDRLNKLKRKYALKKSQSGLKGVVTKLKKSGQDITEAQRKVEENVEEYKALIEALGTDDYVFRKGYKDVPDDILFDLNKGEQFARYYPETWTYRTTRGSGLGKAIMPYSDARVGEIVQGVALGDVKGVKIGKDQNAFLDLLDPRKKNEAERILATARKKMAAQNLIGGMRFQSTSDFRYEYASDYLMAFFEMQAMGANVQLYTKVLEAVDFFANVGCDVNLSVMPRDKGIGVLNEKPRDWDTNYDRYYTLEDGKYLKLNKGKSAPEFEPGKYHAILYSDVTGVNGGAAREYVNKYDNVQMIMVGISADHINACLDSDDITFVIPFHGSGNSTADIQQLMQLLGESIDRKNITDFTDYQTDAQRETKNDARDLRHKIVSGKFLTTDGQIILTAEEANILESNEILRDLFRRFYLDATDRNGRIDISLSKENREKVSVIRTNKDGSHTKLDTPDFGKVNDKAFAKKYYLDGRNECYGNFLSGAAANQIFPYEYWDKSLKQSEAKANGDAFQAYAKSLGLVPRFSGFAKGKDYKAELDFTKNDNYWRLLIDRKMYDNQGNYRAQRQINLSEVDIGNSDRFDFASLNPVYGEVNFGSGSEFANRVNPKAPGKDNSVISKINDPRKTDAIAQISANAIRETRALADKSYGHMFSNNEDIQQAMENKDYITAAQMLRENPTAVFNEQTGQLEVVEEPSQNNGKLSVDDVAYMQAVESGDMETAQAMVDEAARAAGYDLLGYKGIRGQKQGNKYPFTVFKSRPGGFFLATDREVSEAFSKSYDYLAHKSKIGTVLQLYTKFDNPYYVYLDEDNPPDWLNIPTPQEMKDFDPSIEDTTYTEEIGIVAKLMGYDGVILKNVREGSGHVTTDYIATTSDQIKLADPVTYDDNGNIVPLSERFNPENPDMRYSVDEQDLEVFGNWLNSFSSDDRISSDVFESEFRLIPEVDFFKKMIDADWSGKSTKAIEKEFQSFISALDDLSQVRLYEHFDGYTGGSLVDWGRWYNTPRKTLDKFSKRLKSILEKELDKVEYKSLTEEQLDKFRPDYIAAIQQMYDRDESGNFIDDTTWHKSHQALYDLFTKHPELDYLKRLANATTTKEKNQIRAEFEQMLSGINDRDALWQLSVYSFYPSMGTWNGGSRIPGLYDQLKKAKRVFSNIIEKRRDQILMESGESSNVKLEAREYTLQEVIDMFNQLNRDEQLNPLAEKVFKVTKDLGLTIRGAQGKAFSSSKVGGHQLGSVVEYNINRFNDLGITDQFKATILLHELIHSCTQYAIRDYELPSLNLKLNDDMRKAVQQMLSVYREVKADPELTKMYGATDVHEMLSELANPKFREALEEKNLFQRIVDAIKKFFGIETKNALDAASAGLDYLLDNFDYDTYLDYVGKVNKHIDRNPEVTRKAENAIEAMNHPGQIQLWNGAWVDPQYAVESSPGMWFLKDGYMFNIFGELREVDPTTGELVPLGTKDKNKNSPQDGFMSGVIDDNSNYTIEGFFNSLGEEVTVGKFSVDDILSITYFAGAGTFDYALRDRLFPIYAVEYDPAIRDMFIKNNGNSILVTDADVNEVNPGTVLAGHVPYFHASPVCTNFSRANNKSGETERDRKFARSIAKAIRKWQPDVFTLENVRGYIGSDSLQIVLDALDELGYSHDGYEGNVYRASDYGASTIRDRLFVRAVKDGELPPKPAKTGPTSWWDAVKDIIDTLPVMDESGLTEARRNRLKKMRIDINNLKQPILLLSGTKGREIQYAYADQPSPTLMTDGSEARIILTDGTILKVTPRVYARIQGLDDEFQFPTQKRNPDKIHQSDAFKIIGNGIPTQLTRAVVNPLLDIIDKRNGKYSADDEQMASTLQMYEDLVDPSEWKASEHQNMNERMYNRISDGISLWDKIVSFYDTVDEDNYNWLSYEDITQAMRINPYNGNVDGEDMPLASEVMWSLLHLARDQESDVKERIYSLMEEIAPHLVRTEQDKWIRPVGSRFPPIDFDFSNWYNEHNPMPEVGYTPKSLEQLHQEAIEAANEADFQRRAYRRSLATEDEYNRAAEKARRAWNIYNTRFNAEQGKGKFSVDIDPDAAVDSFGYEVELDDYSPVVTQSDLSENLYYSEDGNTAYYMTDTGETVVLNNVGTDSPEARYIEYLEAMQNANDTNTTATKPYIIPPANRNGNDGYNLYQPNAGLRYGAEEVLEENQKGTLRPAGSNGELYAEGVPQSEETQGVRYSAEEESPGARYSTMYDADSDTFVNEKGEIVATDDMYPIGSFTREIFKALKSGDQSLKNVEDIINKLLDRKANIYEEDYNTVRRMIQINDAYTPEQRKAMMDAMDKLVKKHGKMRSAKEDKNQDIHFAVQRDQGDTIDDPNHKGKKITRKEFVKRATEGKDPFTGEDSDKTMTEKEANKLFDQQGTVIMKFTQTVARNTDKEWLTDEAVRMALTDESMSYTPVSNDEAIRRAQQRFDRAGSYEKALADWDGVVNSEKMITQVDVAFGELLLRQAAAEGRINDAIKLTSDLTILAHYTGQALQAFRILKKMTPRGQLYYLQSVVNDLNKKYDSRIKRGTKGMKPIVLNQGLVELLLASSTREELDTAVELIKDDIGKQIPATWADKWNAWRYLAMLGNPRTHIRNMIGNGAFMPAVFIKDMIARQLEDVAHKHGKLKTRNRIAGADLSKNSAYRQRAEQDFEVMKKIIAGEAGGNKFSDIQDILGNRRVFNWGLLDKIEKYNGKKLGDEDLFFMHKYYTRAFAEALQARGIKEEDVQSFDSTPTGRKTLNEIRNWAMIEAQRNTYHDANVLASTLNSLKNKSKVGYVLLEGLVPFTKTPANILKRGIEYSPIGLISSAIQLAHDLRSGEYTTSQCIDRFAGGLTGTAFMALGYLLAKGFLGFKLRGAGPDDDKEAAFEKLQGHQDWSIETDFWGLLDNPISYTIDWMAPSALPLFIGQQLYAMLHGEHPDLTDTDNWMVLLKLADPMLSLSMLDGIENAFSTLSNTTDTSKLGAFALSMGTSYLAQGVPTLFGQVARSIDPDRRSTFVQKDTEHSALKRFIQSSVQAKIPFWENKKMAYVDEWGRTDSADNAAEVIWKIAENFLSPGYGNVINKTPVDDELQRLYESTGDKAVLPNKGEKYWNYGEGEDKVTANLTGEEYEEFSKTRGQTRHEMLAQLFNSDMYQDATDTEKLKMVENVYSYTDKYAKTTITPDYEMDKWMEVAQKIGPVDYILIKQEYEDNKSNEKIFSWLANNPNLNESQVATLIADKFNAPDNVESTSSSGFLYELDGSDEDAIKEINAQIIQSGLRELYRSEEYQNAPDKDVMLRQFYEESKAETIRLYGEMLDQTDRVKYIGKAASIGAESFNKVLDLTTADIKGDYRSNIEAQSSWLGYKYKADTSINNPLHEGYSIELDKTQRSRLESKFRDRWNAAYDELLHSETFQNAPSREYQEDMIAGRFNQVSTEVENKYAAELYQAGGYSETFGKPGSFTWSKAYEIADRELSTPQERGEWLAGKYSPGSSIDDPDQAAYEIPLTTEDKNQLKKEFASAYVPRYVKMVTSAEFKALDPTTQEYKKEELRKDVAKSVQEAYARKLKADGYASVAFDDKANLANKYEYLASNELSDAEKIQIIKDSYVGGTIANAEARGYRKKMFDEWMDNPANTKSYLEQNTADSYKKMREAADKYAGTLTKQKYGNVKNYSDIEDFDLYDVYYTTNNPIDSTPPVKIDAPATSKTDSGALLKPGNIDLNARPIERNSDGTYSTVDSVTWEVDGQFVNVPTVIYVDGEEINGEWVEGWVHVDGDTALNHYFETGEHLGIYSDKESAVKAAQQLSKDQAKQYDSKANFWAGLIRH